MPKTIVEHARNGDVVVSMGAGSIGQVPAQLAAMSSTKGVAA
jgi:UDP-N-acetylmuramate--alanine ligase